MTKQCTTHHHACDCREEMFAEHIAVLEEQVTSLLYWKQHWKNESREAKKRIAVLERILEAAARAGYLQELKEQYHE